LKHNIFLVFSGEGSTDQRFFPILIGRLIEEYFFLKKITAELSWLFVPKKGSSYDNILKACEEGYEHNLVLFHRDSGNVGWDEAYENHFSLAVRKINQDQLYNKNLIAVIPVRELEAWMLADKDLLKRSIGTSLSNNDLSLTYQISRIERIGDPKRVIEVAIQLYHNTLTAKQRRYAARINDMYDIIASEIDVERLSVLESFKKLNVSLKQVLDGIVANWT
jgi:hypothetical protein